MKKINISAVVAAVSAGAGYRFAFEGAAKRVDFVAENYLVMKSMAAGVIGSGLVYFGKSDTSTAAGYALMGIAGDAGAGKVQNLIVSTTGGDKMDGLPRLQRAKGNLFPKRNIANRALMRARQDMPTAFAQRGERMAAGQGRTRPEIGGGVDYDTLAFSDVIYNF
jgi:hypothetical protein